MCFFLYCIILISSNNVHFHTNKHRKPFATILDKKSTASISKTCYFSFLFYHTCKPLSCVWVSDPRFHAYLFQR
ncbi:AAEL017425-PA [Aedes aegypti]|uniref:AAEL017425-PA n=1 Tax=Aedes aegypti TaxID=7159 RepID=J9E9L4_AEDAE|nr:AAEL017425-PA [Aedes aegypti]